jgi:cytoplasmic iron level regulating protein YaaA (DUF328/UPF0246 family)
LIILPPSETKRPAPDDGPPLNLARLSFPELTPMRLRVLDALVATSQGPDALSRLRVRQPLAGEVARNTQLRELPTRHAIDTYSGPLYVGLHTGSWSSDVRSRAARRIVIVSALWGALRPTDRIPPYRLHVCARPIGLDRLEPMWRTLLPTVLAGAAEGGPVLDLRSPTYRAVGRPTGLDAETVMLRVRPAANGPAHIGDVVAKRVRGEAARRLLAASVDPGEPLDIADLLAAHWPIELEPPGGRNRTWTVTLEASA